jgi:hypothetical protein
MATFSYDSRAFPNRGCFSHERFLTAQLPCNHSTLHVLNSTVLGRICASHQYLSFSLQCSLQLGNFEQVKPVLQDLVTTHRCIVQWAQSASKSRLAPPPGIWHKPPGIWRSGNFSPTGSTPYDVSVHFGPDKQFSSVDQQHIDEIDLQSTSVCYSTNSNGSALSPSGESPPCSDRHSDMITQTSSESDTLTETSAAHAQCGVPFAIHDSNGVSDNRQGVCSRICLDDQFSACVQCSTLRLESTHSCVTQCAQNVKASSVQLGLDDIISSTSICHSSILTGSALSPFGGSSPCADMQLDSSIMAAQTSECADQEKISSTHAHFCLADAVTCAALDDGVRLSDTLIGKGICDICQGIYSKACFDDRSSICTHCASLWLESKRHNCSQDVLLSSSQGASRSNHTCESLTFDLRYAHCHVCRNLSRRTCVLERTFICTNCHTFLCSSLPERKRQLSMQRLQHLQGSGSVSASEDELSDMCVTCGSTVIQHKCCQCRISFCIDCYALRQCHNCHMLVCQLCYNEACGLCNECLFGIDHDYIEHDVLDRTSW